MADSKETTKKTRIYVHPQKHDLVWGQKCPPGWRVVAAVETNDEAWRTLQKAILEKIVYLDDGRYIASERTSGTLSLIVFADELQSVYNRHRVWIRSNTNTMDRTSDCVLYETADLVPTGAKQCLKTLT